MVDRMFAFVRSYKPTRIAHIREAERHAKGENRSAQKRRRKDADARALAMALSPENCMSKPRVAYPTGHPQCPPEQPELDLEYAFSRYLDQESASVRKGAALGLHMIVGVSPEYFENEADRHNPNSRAVRELLLAACDWAELELGGTWAARYDVDEAGSGVVDVFCSPLRTDKRTNCRWVSVNQAQLKLAAKWKQKYGYRAMQDSWAAFASTRLGQQFKRGEPARKSKRKHVLAEIYGEAMEEGKALMQENERLVAENEWLEEENERLTRKNDSLYLVRQERKQLEEDRAKLELEEDKWARSAAPRAAVEAEHENRLATLRKFIHQRPWAWAAWPREADTVLAGQRQPGPEAPH